MSRVAASSRSECTIRGPTPAATPASVASSGSPSKAIRSTPLCALDDDERAERGGERGVDGIGQALAHGRGGEPVEEGVGQGSHEVTLSRRVRTAVDTRWRAASGEVPSSTAMRS